MTINWEETLAAVWRQQKQHLRPIREPDPIRLSSLVGIERQKAELKTNTRRFIEG
jgi:hypothetical protein